MKQIIVLIFFLFFTCCIGQETTTTTSTTAPTTTTTTIATLTSTSMTTSTTWAPSALMVHIRDFSAKPKDVSITKGNAVTWINYDPVHHNVVFEGFSSEKLKKGDMFTHTFNETGTFHYYCSIHKKFMRGTVTVT